jgi:hypothetical protein
MSTVTFYTSTGFWRQKLPLYTRRKRMYQLNDGDTLTVCIPHANFHAEDNYYYFFCHPWYTSFTGALEIIEKALMLQLMCVG